MLFTIGQTEMADIISVMTGIIGDLMPLTLLIMGLAIAFWILNNVFIKADNGLTDEQIDERLREIRNKKYD